jgi:branched-chain amino acid transport system substrate-binding protein
MGLAVAERWAQQSAPGGRAVNLQLEDGASDQPSAIAAFNLLIRPGVIALIGHFISRVSAQSSEIAPLSIDEALRSDPSIKRVAVFYAQDDAYSTAEVAIFQKVLAARGLTPITVQRTQLADNDFQTPITSTLQLNPQLVVFSVQAVAGGNLIRQLRELGYRSQIVVGNGLNTPNIYPICQRW